MKITDFPLTPLQWGAIVNQHRTDAKNIKETTDFKKLKTVIANYLISESLVSPRI
jgi:hypothetical protein